nr:hypothetical protein [Tanacetum cinerariifolium]
MHSIGKTIAELHAMLKLYEKGIPKKAETRTVLAIREGKIHKDKKKTMRGKGDNPKKDSVCHHYKEVGYWRRNYPSYQADLKRTKNASVASTSGSSKLKHRALSLYMGNGMYVVVEAIGSFDLVLPNGLIIVLDNYNVFYFNAIPHGGIYKINMHNLYPNVSFMFNVSNKRAKYALDSSYLWYYRVGHMNKKHMDKLQRDGILQPTHDESLEKCKSCISGKMAQAFSTSSGKS